MGVNLLPIEEEIMEYKRVVPNCYFTISSGVLAVFFLLGMDDKRDSGYGRRGEVNRCGKT